MPSFTVPRLFIYTGSRVFKESLPSLLPTSADQAAIQESEILILGWIRARTSQLNVVIITVTLYYIPVRKHVAR